MANQMLETNFNVSASQTTNRDGNEGIFVRHVMKNLGKKDSYVLKRSFGSSIKSVDIAVYLSFLSITDGFGVSKFPGQEEVNFLVASLICANEPLRSEWAHTNGSVPFETLLGKMYQNTTDSGRRRLRQLFMTDISNGEFASSFRRIFNEMKQKVIVANINYVALLRDLRNWDSESKWPRKKWAMAMMGQRTLDD